MSEVEGGKPFSQVIKDAKKLGYTEPGNETTTMPRVYIHLIDVLHAWLSIYLPSLSNQVNRPSMSEMKVVHFRHRS